MNNNINLIDKKIFNLIKQEQKRQQSEIVLIASENYVSLDVMKAQGSCLTNKYAEGYIGNRYYGGCRYVDEIESIAISRLKKLYNADFANVQLHSGTQANLAVYFALLNVGDTVLGLSLNHGGHLTHGSPYNLSGKLFNFISYYVDIHTGDIDYTNLFSLALKYKPKMIIAGFSSFPGLLDWFKFKEIANKVNAILLADISHISGLIAAKIHENPINYVDVITSTTHKTLRGPRGGFIISNNYEIFKKIQHYVFPGSQGGPFMHTIAAKAIAFKEASTDSFRSYQCQVLKNAKIMLFCLKNNGIDIVSNDTKNHIILINLLKKKLTGDIVEKSLENAGIIVNKNCIPSDIYSPNITSGIRIGTSAITTRGFKEKECLIIANWISNIINDINNINLQISIKNKVIDMCKQFTIYNDNSLDIN